jgi:tripartite-type tricarboxylate transporter receptor subunit TctC
VGAHPLVAGRSDHGRGGPSRRRGRLRRRKDTASEIVETLNREVQKIIAEPGFHERMAAIGVDVVDTMPAAYAKIISDDYAKWGKVNPAAGIKPE